jgi:hypothetical protein
MSSFRARSIFENEIHNGTPYTNMQHHSPLSSVRPVQDHRATRQRGSPNGGWRLFRGGRIICILFVLAVIVRNEENQRMSISDETEFEARSLPVSVSRNDSTGGKYSISGNYSNSRDGGVDELIWRFRVPPTGGYYDMPMFKHWRMVSKGRPPSPRGVNNQQEWLCGKEQCSAAQCFAPSQWDSAVVTRDSFHGDRDAT